MMKSVICKLLIRFISIFIFTSCFAQGILPGEFDLRDYNGNRFVSQIKQQSGGTCWAHGTISAIESNLMLSGVWEEAEESGEPDMAEYHLDWWNGFNSFYNEDIYPEKEGLTVHQGGDYLVASAYLARGDGAVRDVDGQSFKLHPPLWNESYHIYYVRDMDWYTAGPNLERIDIIKSKIVEHGVMGTCMYSDSKFMDKNYIHYQPFTDPNDPNHAVAIVGWNDSLITQAPLPGAWLCKNSWGVGWGNHGFFWISYYDKYCGQHPEMGAISFYNIEPLQYADFYFHDYHGWRSTKLNCQEAFNTFTARNDEYLTAVNFYTASDDVTYTVRIYSHFEDEELVGLVSTKKGSIPFTGFHTVDLDTVVQLSKDDRFFIYLNLSQGGHPYDCTSIVPLLLGTETSNTWVRSTANSQESYFKENAQWIDLISEDSTANFCIKGLTKLEVDYSLPIAADPARTPTGFILNQNHPNPFNRNTTIQYRVPYASQVELKIYNLLGMEIVKLIDEYQIQGNKSISWDGRNHKGHEVSSGIYIYILKTEQKQLSGRMVLIK